MPGLKFRSWKGNDSSNTFHIAFCEYCKNRWLCKGRMDLVSLWRKLIWNFTSLLYSVGLVLSAVPPTK